MTKLLVKAAAIAAAATAVTAVSAGAASASTRTADGLIFHGGYATYAACESDRAHYLATNGPCRQNDGGSYYFIEYKNW